MSETIADDILEGAAEISVYIGKTVRQTQWLLESKRIPAFKLGGRWHLRPSTYRTFIERLEAEATQAA